MKTIKNKLVLIFAMAFVVAFSLSVVTGIFAITNKAFAASPFEGDEVAFSTTKIQFDVTPDTYDFFTFEYKFDTDDLDNNRLGVYLMDGNSTKYYGYYYFKQDGTFTQTYSHIGGVSTTADGEWIKVVFTVSELEDRKGDANGANKPADLMRFYAKADSGTGLVRNASFYFAPAETIEMVEGASVRLSEPYGIRFRANLGDGIATDEDATFGMAIIPYEWITTYSAQITAANNDYIAVLDAADVNYRKFDCTPVKDGDDYYIQASLTNIKETNLTKEFIGIAWFEKAGVKTYAYNENCARSIKTAAAMAIVAENDALNANDEHTYENTYTSKGRAYLFDQATNYSLGTEGFSLALSDKVVKGDSVIEFYYKKKTSGSIRFAVIGDSWQDYYGYYEISDNLSFDKGVQVMPMGETWQYDGTNTDALVDADNLWYRVVIDPASLQKATGDPSAQTWFNVLYFSGCTATFDIIGVTVRERTVEDGAYYIMGKNQVQTRSYHEPSIDLSGKSELSFYIKEVSAKGKKYADSYVNLRFDFDTGSNTGYVSYNSSASGAVAVTEGEYAGWYKVTISLDSYSSPTAISVFYSRYTQGEYFVGGFSAS